MLEIIFNCAALLAYLLAFAAILTERAERLALVVAVGVACHTVALIADLFHGGGVNLGLGVIASLVGWEAAAMWAFAAMRLPLQKLGVFVLPVAACGVVLAFLLPADLTGLGGPLLTAHVLSSIMAYGLLTVAAAQALLFAAQERALRGHSDSWLQHGLPPLEAMETLLFRAIAVGFWLLSCSLLSGLFFVDDLFAQHLAHKTILSCVSWLVFGGLLLGRARRGWRGRTAVKATLSGYFVLLLAYFGSRWILELVLERSWGG